LRWSHVFVWLATALASVWELRGQRLHLLSAALAKNVPMAAALWILAKAQRRACT
jgi:hypothetical protein